MKQIAILFLLTALLSACGTRMPRVDTAAQDRVQYMVPPLDTLITQSLFNDRSSTISEENIQKILDGTYKLPKELRIAIVRLDGGNRRYYWNDEEYLKTQQAYMDMFVNKFQGSSRVKTVSLIPDLLMSRSPSFTNLREAAVRMQADVLVVYSITSDIYSRYKIFSKTDIKAFATTQLVILDVRTGLVPFSSIVTRDVLSEKRKEETGYSEASARIQKEAVVLTIEQIGQNIATFLNQK